MSGNYQLIKEHPEIWVIIVIFWYFFKNWWVIALQCCVGFSHTTQISHNYIYISISAYIYRCWKRLRAGGEGDNRRWDVWMASPTQWTWVWLNSRSWWWTGRPGVLQSMGSQRVGHDWATELNWCYFLNLSHPLLPLLCPQVCSACLRLYSYPANRFINTIL